MGFIFSSIFSGLVGSEQMRIIIIGLDNAGKTTILCKCTLELAAWWDARHLNKRVTAYFRKIDS